MAGYFSLFPNTVYNNTNCLDLAARIDVTRKLRGNPRNFYPLDVNEGVRPDLVAQKYFGSSDYTWLVHVGAGIVDPYYDWVLDSGAFANVMMAQYGSTNEAMLRTHHWALIWPGAALVTQQISPAVFSELDSDLQQYYQPVYTYGVNIVAYTLRQEDWTETTNMFVDLTVANVVNGSSNGYILDERINVLSGNTLLGNGQVAWSNSSQVTIQHVTGNTSTTNTTLLGCTSNTSATITNAGNPFYNITPDEQAYWQPVSAWDYYNDINEQHRHVTIVNSRYTQEAQKELKVLLGNTTQNALQ